ncbi:MAG: protein kinase domain-containing protein [Gammaproteobacteria bacterium]
MLISGKYAVQGQLGQGSMGVVYKVEHIALGTTSALKVLQTHLQGNPEVVKRFYREARVMARLNHSNIARVVDVHRDDALQFHYFVMEYVEGKTLRQYLQGHGPVPLAAVLDITRQVARALDYAHSYNPPVIHRDIKPTNIIIENGSQRVVVTDFGIAKEIAEEVDQTEITRAGTLLGTLKYCPPEQMRNEPLDGSADIYALGMVLYEAYTGGHLFDGLNEHEIVAKVLNPGEYELSFKEPTPAEFAMLVRRTIAKTPAQRYRRMADLLSDLEACRSTLDETTSGIGPVGTTMGLSPKGLNTDVTLHETQFHELAEERERRLAVQLQAKARESREKAVREGAGQLAPNPFKEGCEREQAGLEHVSKDQFSLAQEAYQEAAQLFGRACEQAIAEALIQRAEQARQEMLSARAQADRYRAKDRARTVYERGLKLQGQGEDLWEHQSYTEVWQIYSEARSLFEEAQQLAYRGSREEAKAAQIELKAARERAIEGAAEELAPQAFWDAVGNEGAADTALAQEDFTQAVELYRTANRQFELARQHASSEPQHRQAMQQQAKEVQQRTHAGAPGPPEHRQTEGNLRLEKQAFEDAAEAYESDGHEQAGQEGAEAAKLVAQQREAQERGVTAADRFAEAMAAAAEQKQHGEAQTDFERSMGLLRQIELNARADRQREQAKRAKARAQTLQEKASRTKGGRRSQGNVQGMVSHADRLFQQERYPEALAKFDEAASLLLLGVQPNALSVVGALRLARIARWVTRYSGPLLVLLVLVAVVYLMRFPTRPSVSDLTPPSISAWTPEQEGEVVVVPGQTQIFTVQAKGSPQARPLRYAWFLNEEKQAEGPQWTYRPEMWEIGEQPREVRLVVSDRNSRTVEKRWQIRVASASHRPRIDEASPFADSLEIITGGSQKFYVRASNPDPSDPLAFLWFLDGGRVAEGEGWEFQAPATEGSHRVTVEVRDQTGSVDQRSWQVRVKAAPPSSGGLTISQVSPVVESEQEFIIGVGQRQIFTIKGESLEQSTLSYSWFLDSKKRGEGMQFVYRPRPIEARLGIRELKAVITDDRGQSLEKVWRVRIQEAGRGPEIIAASPLNTELITLAAGALQGFSAEASDPGNGHQLTYVWSLDGREMARGTSWSWKPGGPHEAGVHTVAVTVFDSAGLNTQHIWKVNVPVPSEVQVADDGARSQLESTVPSEPPGIQQSDSSVRIQRAISSLATARPGDTVEFVTEYSLTLPAETRDEFVKVTWALERKGKKLGEEGIHTRMAKAGAHAVSNQLTLPKYMRPGRYAVEHKVQAGDSYDIARSYFSVAN